MAKGQHRRCELDPGGRAHQVTELRLGRRDRHASAVLAEGFAHGRSLDDILKSAVDNNIHSVSPDRSYLESWVWQETGGGAAGGELHVNLRAYPGRTKIPTCRTGGSDSRNVPCFASPVGRF